MINDKNILAVTLARGGSSRIYKKNIAILNGKPLLQYTAEEVAKSKYVDYHIVSTDDDEIIEVCKRIGVDYHIRPHHLATAKATSSSAVIDAVENLKTSYYYVIDIPCTNPLKTSEDIDGCIEKLVATGADSVVAVVRGYDSHPARAKYIENDHLVDFYPEVPESMRQDLSPPCYFRNGSVYATTCESLLETGIRLGKDTRPYIMPEERTINIDEEIDLELARILLRKRVGNG
tara:strand:+ start:1861 stop:2559 length:699 start_codon:yes stop_codon:yes gene_type:complete